jgi:2,4-dienoyl-CoA reductase-like NADH-dependent reductase (Old Yellow Enzyme family)
MNPEKLFEPCTVMGLSLPNRFIRSATLEGLADADGAPSSELKRVYTDLATGGVGLISTSACLADREWVPSSVRFLSLHSDHILSRWEDMVRAVHQAGARLSVQLAPFFLVNGNPVGPFAYKEGIKPLSLPEIEQLVSLYALAAERAKILGADAVQVHGGHGYPLSQFLSPFYNRRQDNYGGSPFNRTRIFLDIRRAVADRCGEAFPVWIKMNALEGIPGGIAPEDAEIYGQLLSAGGYGAIEVTGGSLEGSYDSRGPLDKKLWVEGYYVELASRVKAHSRVPVVAVGGLRDLTMIETIFSEDKADLMAMSRPFIHEPDLIRRWRSRDRRPALCQSCNGCLASVHQGKGLRCVQRKPEQGLG